MMMPRRNDDTFNAMSFPSKMHVMLDDAEPRGFEDVIAWQPGGKSFKVHQPKQFTQEVMRLYFAQTKFKSFQRQLNIYGWRKVHHGPNKGGYLHKLFVQGKLDLSSGIFRCTSTEFNSVDEQHCSSSSSTVTPLAALVIAPTTSTTTGSTSTPLNHKHSAQQSMDLNETEVKSFFDFFYPEATTENAMIDSILTSAAAVSTSSRDDCAEEGGGYELESDHSFPFKLHLMLEHAKRDNYQHVVSWVKDGSAFKVHNNKEFVRKVLPLYFDQSKYESFRRQLNLYGFQRVPRGVDRGVIAHPHMHQGTRESCSKIKRKTQVKVV